MSGHSATRTGELSHPPLVLLVEDDESNREMYSVFLESAGYWVLGARNGLEGLVNAREYHPHVIVTDISMPGMDGWEFASALRNDTRTSKIGIIAVSGRDDQDEEVQKRVRQHDVDVVLTKPCLPEELLREIRKLLVRGRLARQRAGEHLAKARQLRERSEDLLKRAIVHQRRRR